MTLRNLKARLISSTGRFRRRRPLTQLDSWSKGWQQHLGQPPRGNPTPEEKPHKAREPLLFREVQATGLHGQPEGISYQVCGSCQRETKEETDKLSSEGGRLEVHAIGMGLTGPHK